MDRLGARERELLSEIEKERAEQREYLERELGKAHAEHGDTRERLRLMTEQEARLADELRGTYAEVERLTRLVADMESTRAWRFHQWWQRRKP